MSVWMRIGKKLEYFFENVASATGIIDINSTINSIPSRAYSMLGSIVRFPLIRDSIIDYSKSVWYLKINRRASYTLKCIQNWINIAKEYKASIIFVCDNPRLQFDVLRKCNFYDVPFAFIKSKKNKKIARNLYTGYWEKATYAHLTPIYHAAKRKLNHFWNIDGDDTMFLLYPEKVAHILREVETLSKDENIDAISLDMHCSKSLGINWTLGVLLINDPNKIIELIENNHSLSWGEELKEYTNTLNLDWFLTYAKRHNMANLQTFYADNCGFIHWGDLFINPTAAWINYWSEGFVHYPILEDIFHLKAGKKEIVDCIKIDVNSTIEEGYRFWENEISNTRLLTNEQRHLQHLENEFCDSHNLINL